MPIRFRCAYCNQLMGISRRKAGSVVKCPKCAGDIIVPVPDGMQPENNGNEQPGDFFNDPNFDPEGESPANASTGETPATEQAVAPLPVPAPPLPPAPAPQRLGVYLSLGSLVISIVVVILLLILTFVLGLIIGKQTTPAITACFVSEPEA